MEFVFLRIPALARLFLQVALEVHVRSYVKQTWGWITTLDSFFKLIYSPVGCSLPLSQPGHLHLQPSPDRLCSGWQQFICYETSHNDKSPFLTREGFAFSERGPELAVFNTQ
jgi:hypothetical protein